MTTKSLFGVLSSVVMTVAIAMTGASPAMAQDAKPKEAPAQPKEKPGQGAPAQPPPPPVDAPSTSAAAEVKAAKGVDKREPVEEGSSFTAGTRVWAWSRITGANGTKVKHVWKKDGKPVWSAFLRVKSTKWVTHSRRVVKAGEWTVDVVGEDGTTLGTVSFTVQ